MVNPISTSFNRGIFWQPGCAFWYHCVYQGMSGGWLRIQTDRPCNSIHIWCTWCRSTSCIYKECFGQGPNCLCSWCVQLQHCRNVNLLVIPTNTCQIYVCKNPWGGWVHTEDGPTSPSWALAIGALNQLKYILSIYCGIIIIFLAIAYLGAHYIINMFGANWVAGCHSYTARWMQLCGTSSNSELNPRTDKWRSKPSRRAPKKNKCTLAPIRK